MNQRNKFLVSKNLDIRASISLILELSMRGWTLKISSRRQHPGRRMGSQKGRKRSKKWKMVNHHHWQGGILKLNIIRTEWVPLRTGQVHQQSWVMEEVVRAKELFMVSDSPALIILFSSFIAITHNEASKWNSYAVDGRPLSDVDQLFDRANDHARRIAHWKSSHTATSNPEREEEDFRWGLQ